MYSTLLKYLYWPKDMLSVILCHQCQQRRGKNTARLLWLTMKCLLHSYCTGTCRHRSNSAAPLNKKHCFKETGNYTSGFFLYHYNLWWGDGISGTNCHCHTGTRLDGGGKCWGHPQMGEGQYTCVHCLGVQKRAKLDKRVCFWSY